MGGTRNEGTLLPRAHPPHHASFVVMSHPGLIGWADRPAPRRHWRTHKASPQQQASMVSTQPGDGSYRAHHNNTHLSVVVLLPCLPCLPAQAHICLQGAFGRKLDHLREAAQRHTQLTAQTRENSKNGASAPHSAMHICACCTPASIIRKPSCLWVGMTRAMQFHCL